MMDGGHTSGRDVGSVGEVSYRVFLDVGGPPKTSRQRYPNNTFPTTFMVFPNSSGPKLSTLAKADNTDDLPMLIAFGEQAGYADRSGKSGKPLLDVQRKLQHRIGENAERLLLSFCQACRVHEQIMNINFAKSQVLSAIRAASSRC
jgi:hypothetical protein